MSNSGKTEIKKGCCIMCPGGCGLEAHVENGRIVRVAFRPRHLAGDLCVKGKNLATWVYAEDRITTPLRRVNGQWKEVSWDEAFDFICDKLKTIKERYGPKALVVTFGCGMVGRADPLMIGRFCQAYGTPNLVSAGSSCFNSRLIGTSLTYGYTEDINLTLMASFGRANCEVVWGRNPSESSRAFLIGIIGARDRGAKLIVVDPKRTPIAEEADIHCQIRPGTDLALALGLLNVIINEELYDKEFVRDCTVGFDALVKHVQEYTPEKVEEITWIPARTVKDFARTIATIKPVTHLTGIAPEHSPNAVQFCRAIAILSGITGNLEIRGGNWLVQNMWPSAMLFGRLSAEGTCSPKWPLYTWFLSEAQEHGVPDAILTEKPYPVKALISAGRNLALLWPNSNKVRKAIDKLELFVAIDFFMSETAKLADIFLPASTALEYNQVREMSGEGPNLVTFGEKVIEPVGNSMPDWQMWYELGKRMGYEFPEKSDIDVINTFLKPMGLNVDELKNRGWMTFWSRRETQAYLKEGFKTASGKAEIYSEFLAGYGYDPLPTYHEPRESLANKELAEKYPLALITGRRNRVFTHSRHRNVPFLRRLQPENTLEIHLSTAESLGITDKDMVLVESPRGSVEIKTKLTDKLHPRVVSMEHGWPEANANLLTDDEDCDPIDGFPPLRTGLCRITKLDQNR